MQVNADFDQRVVVHANELPWQDSPMPGVQRRMLDRLGDEVARATTIVRYAPGSHFSPHVHTGGEEFLVLDGVFQDEHGDFPAGAYLRNPPQSSHTPGSEPGCVILVKLWQFDPDDRTHVRTHIDRIGQLEDPARPGVCVTPLYEDARERVQIEDWAAGTAAPVDTRGGAEVFVLAGDANESGDRLRADSWVRLPEGFQTELTAGAQGLKMWVKSGHLRHVAPPGA